MKSEITKIVEFIGIFGVIASLIFVGMQLRLEGQLAEAEQYAFRSESLKSDIRTRLESDSHMSVLVAQWDRGERPQWWNPNFEDYVLENGLSGEEIWNQILNTQLFYFQSDNLYFQYQQGFLEEETWLNLRNRAVRGSLRNPIGREIYLQAAMGRPIDSVVEELIVELDNEQ